MRATRFKERSIASRLIVARKALKNGASLQQAARISSIGASKLDMLLWRNLERTDDQIRSQLTV